MIFALLIYTTVGFFFGFSHMAMSIRNPVIYHILVGPVSWIGTSGLWLWYLIMNHTDMGSESEKIV